MTTADLAFNVLWRDKGAQAGLDRLAGSAEKAQSKMAKFGNVAKIGAGLAGVALLKLGKDAVGTSRKMVDLDNKARTVFEDQLASVNKWADANKKAFGLSQRETVGLAASFADLLKPMGFTAEQAAAMSTDVVGLSGALSKWSAGQFTAAEVSEKLSKAMLGEREELKSLGISISEADVKQRLLEKGQQDLTGAALQQAEAIATQELIMEKSTDAQKAWADGGKKAAEQQNATKTASKELQESLATFLSPAIETATGWLAKLADWATKNKDIAGPLAIGLGVLAGGIWLINFAMSANPAVLMLAGFVALGVGVVILWRKFETFRNVVTGAWTWIRRNWPLLLGIITGPFGLAVGIIIRNKDTILRIMRGVPGGIRSGLRGLTEALTAPFRAAWNAIKALWNRTLGGRGFDIPSWVPFGIGGKSFKFPKLAEGGIVPATPGGRLVIAGEGGQDEAIVPLGRGRRVGDMINITISGAVGDPEAIARMIHDQLLKLQRSGTRLGFAS